MEAKEKGSGFCGTRRKFCSKTERNRVRDRER